MFVIVDGDADQVVAGRPGFLQVQYLLCIHLKLNTGEKNSFGSMLFQIVTELCIDECQGEMLRSIV